MKKFVIMFLFLSPYISFAQNNITENINNLFKYIDKHNGFSGTVLVSEGGKIIYEEAFGYANYELEIKNRVETAFDVASAIKPFTALGILILCDNGKLSLDDELHEIFDDFPDYGIKVKHLLSHTSGLPDYGHNHKFLSYLKNKVENNPEYNVTNKDLINWYSQINPDINPTPGEKFSYCNGGYVLLASIIEKISDMPFYDFLRINLIEPVEMENSKFYDEIDQYDETNTAIGYEMKIDGSGYKQVHSKHIKFPGEGFKGDGGLYSTVVDLQKLLSAFYDGNLISEQMREKALTKYVLNSGKKCPYGYGWIIREEGYEDRPFTIKHGGRWEGFLTAYAYEPQNKNSIIILTNNSLYPPSIGEIEKAISNIISEKEFSMPRFPIRDTIAHTIYKKGIDEALKTYKTLKKFSYDKYFFDMHQLNLLGYLLLWEGKKEEALQILKLNAEEYPDEWNSYDSLGDIYKELDDIENAKKAYEKAIELNPERKKTISKLNELDSD